VPSLKKRIEGFFFFCRRCSLATDLCREFAPVRIEVGLATSPAFHLRCPKRPPRHEAPPLPQSITSRSIFPSRRLVPTRPWVYAVDGVSFEFAAWRDPVSVGDSGCGKSTVVPGLLRLFDITAAMVAGTAAYRRSFTVRASRMRARVQVVFHDPFSIAIPDARARQPSPSPSAIRPRKILRPLEAKVCCA